MALSLDIITLEVPEVGAAQEFYTSVYATTAASTPHQITMDLHGVGRLALSEHQSSATPGFDGYLLSYIVEQPTEVDTLLSAAVHSGASVLKPAKKGFFGGYSAVYKAPDGATWKLAAPTKKDRGPATDPPRPTETAAFLGVAAPKASKVFYETLGMAVDRDYGDKFVDFRLAPGACRLGLMPRPALAKDAGVDLPGEGAGTLILHHRADSRDEVDTLLSAAGGAGGTITVEAGDTADGYAGQFADLDGFRWQVWAA